MELTGRYLLFMALISNDIAQISIKDVVSFDHVIRVVIGLTERLFSGVFYL